MTDYRKLQNGSDIRGTALPGVPGEEVNLTAEAARMLTAGFVKWLQEKTGKTPAELTLAVGRDPRLSGEALAAAVTETGRSLGLRVLDCGLASTPAMFMATVFPDFSADGAVMVTASHLPFNKNGLKFFSRAGGLDKSDIQEIADTASRLDTPAQILADAAMGACDGSLQAAAAAAGKAGSLTKADLMAAYSAHLRKLITDACVKGGLSGDEPLKGLKICVDAGNGSGGFYAGEVLEPLGADVSSSQFLSPDGHFPNHAPNPENQEAIESLTCRVKAAGCDLGLIFDTDVDRSSAVDEQGREINRNGIVALAAALIADDHPGTTIVTDSITSNELTDFLEGKLGLHHLRYMRGYRNVINKGQALNAAGTDCQLAIETSGHAAYKDNYFLDDGAFLAARIVVKSALLHREWKGISSVTADLKEPAEAVEIRMPILAADYRAAGDEILDYVNKWIRESAQSYCNSVCAANSGAPGAKGIQIHLVKPNYEGIRVAFSGCLNGWFLLRKSLHDPIMPLNIEAEERGGCRMIAGMLHECLAIRKDLDTTGLTQLRAK